MSAWEKRGRGRGIALLYSDEDGIILILLLSFLLSFGVGSSFDILLLSLFLLPCALRPGRSVQI